MTGAPSPGAPGTSAQSSAHSGANRTSRPLRLLLVADVDPVQVIGGAERMLNEHSVRLAARGHDVTVLTRQSEPGLALEERYRGVHVVRHPVRGIDPFSFIRSVLQEGGRTFSRLMRAGGFDLINVHQPLEGHAVLRRSESRGIPVLYTYLSPWSDEYRVRFQRRLRECPAPVRIAAAPWVALNSRLRERIERGNLRRSDGVMVLSEFSESQIHAIHHLRHENVAIIPGGVDIERFHPLADRARTRRELGLPEGLLFLTVRNLVPRMGLESLVEAMRKVVAIRPDAKLCIGGSGPLREPLEAQARALGLEGIVRFAGFIPEDRLPDYYGTADLFLLPTRCLEGFGLVTIEALACGTPVLGTPIGGTQEILKAFDPAYLFAGTSAEQIAERILDRLPVIEGSAQIRARCRRFAEEQYGWDGLVDRVENFMRGLADGSAADALGGLKGGAGR